MIPCPSELLTSLSMHQIKVNPKRVFFSLIEVWYSHATLAGNQHTNKQATANPNRRQTRRGIAEAGKEPMGEGERLEERSST